MYCVKIYYYYCLLYLTTSLIFFIIDIFVPCRIKNTQKKELLLIYFKISWTVIKNLIYALPYFIIFYMCMNKNHRIITFENNGLYIFMEIILLNIFTYLMHSILHRLLHTWLLYSYHEKNHEITKPIGLSLLYTTKLELFFKLLIPTLPLYILSTPEIICQYWLGVYIVITTCCKALNIK